MAFGVLSRRFVLAAAGAVALFGAAASGAEPAGEQVRGVILRRLQAYSRGDLSAYRRMLAPGFVHVSDTGQRRSGAELERFVREGRSRGVRFEVTDLHAQAAGQLVLVEAMVLEEAADMQGAFRESDVLIRQGGGLLFLRHAESAVPQPPQPTAVSGDHLPDYAGTYRSPAGTTDVISAKDGRLFGQSGQNGQSEAATPFIQVGQGAFAVPDDPTLLVFVRDRTGAVTGCIWHLPSGQVIRSVRVGGAS